MKSSCTFGYHSYTMGKTSLSIRILQDITWTIIDEKCSGFRVGYFEEGVQDTKDIWQHFP